MVTQKDVAELAGVSFITVSRVINGETNVKEETRLKVQKAINKLGYAPSFAGQVLNSGKCNTIAILTPIPFYQSMRTFYLMQLISGIEAGCRKKNLDLLLGFAPEAGTDSTYDYLRPYRQKKVDGIIYVGLKQLPEEMIHELRVRKLPCVVIGDRPESSLISWVDTDNYDAGYNTVRQIWDKGHRRIAFVGLKDEIYNANVIDREKGYIQALTDFGADYNPHEYIIRTDFDSPDIQSEVKEKLEGFSKLPTAIFCCADSIVPAVVKAIKELGMSVPEDISIVGFDGFINSTFFDLDTATNPQPLKEMGEKAMEILVNKIKHPSSKKETAVLKVPFRHGESLRKL
ncbi:MAG: LacI family DNA-binding transcriptional regulator [Treponema sp.]|nr:LacI family DNA-binding transcriptional regulator [Candidatus Treponema equifaecale]